MADTTTITLGGREIEVRPLKLGAMRGLLDALDAMQGKEGGQTIEAAVDVLLKGLPHATDLTAEMLLNELDITLEQMNAAVETVIRVAGRLKPRQPGEAKPQPAA